VTEACVVGIPDALKGQMPFAFVMAAATDATQKTPSHQQQQQQQQQQQDEDLFGEIQTLVRSQVGAIATLGGIIVSRGGASIIPKTRSGKTLRRVLRELVENGVHGEFARAVSVPSTVEDVAVVQTAREKVKEYFVDKGGRDRHRAVEVRAKL